ncbi:MAG: HAD-IA family hydrolase, partial [Erysipelothrix sp.]|nr:HAD-IA family hydrolase [Erysipelothrix sp.]
PSNYMKQIRKVIDNDSIVDEVRQHQREAYHGYFAENNPDIMEGALSLLEALRKMDVKIALATSTRKESATRSLNKVGLFEKFDYLVFGDMVSNSKPNPEIYNKVIEDLGILKKDAVILEDSYHGIKAANNAEIDVIWVKDFIDHSDKKDIHYSRMFDSLAEAHQYVVDLVQK